MKKKIVAICLCLALAAVAVVGASLAYFTDTDEAKNTFTVGNVKIELLESSLHRENAGIANGKTSTSELWSNVEKEGTGNTSKYKAGDTFYTDAQGQLSAACLTFFLEGVPMIYSSQEIGNMEKINFFNYNILSFEDNAARQAYIALMKAYTATAEARYGTIIDYSTDHVAMFSRSQESKEILVIVNTTNAEQEITLPMRWQRNKYTNAITGEQIYSPKSQSLQPYEYIIYSK